MSFRHPRNLLIVECAQCGAWYDVEYAVVGNLRRTGLSIYFPDPILPDMMVFCQACIRTLNPATVRGRHPMVYVHCFRLTREAAWIYDNWIGENAMHEQKTIIRRHANPGNFTIAVEPGINSDVNVRPVLEDLV